MARLFLSYRRDDTGDLARALAAKLEHRYLPRNVFFDRESLPGGAVFPERISSALNAATVCMVLIGPGWLAAASQSGERRLDDPEDWVRREIETALARGAQCRVIPVLLKNAAMPQAQDLPESLRGLVDCQAFRIGENFSSDARELMRQIGAPSHWKITALVASAAVLALTATYFVSRPDPQPAPTDEVKTLELTVTSPQPSYPTEEQARAATLAQARRSAEALCRRSYGQLAFELIRVDEPKLDRFDCQAIGGGHACRFEGQAVCVVRQRRQ